MSQTISELVFTFVPFEKAIDPPPDLIKHWKNHWWIVHPEKGLAFYRGSFPQANTNEVITRRLATNYPWAEVRFFPSVFMKIDPQDYCGH
jgi:hypothetical protein